jgi:hypothetical protein
MLSAAAAAAAAAAAQQNFYTSEGIVVGIYPETKHPTCECITAFAK